MNSPYASIALIAVLVLLMYFVVLRPQRKRQQKQQETLRTMEPGSRVMTTSGIYATLLHVGEKQMVLETSPGVEITVLKQAVAKVVPEGEEDEPAGYQVDDETDQLDAAPAPSNAPWPPTTGYAAGNTAGPDPSVWSDGTRTSSDSAERDHLGSQEASAPAGGTSAAGATDDTGSSALGDSSLTDDPHTKRD